MAAKAAAEKHLKEVEEQRSEVEEQAANPGQGHFLKSMFGFKSNA